MKAAFTARVNFATSRRSRTLFLLVEKVYNWNKPTKKLLACSASEGTSQHLNKVSRENSCARFLFFRIYFLFF